jgi:glyoxylase-like metal-dependent hydrolase (beta-lactamase superfamily II)
LNPVPLHAFNPGPMTGAGNWTWLLRGRVTTLIDAGTGDSRHLDELEKALGGESLAQVLVTHGHGDHASGVTALASRHPSARFMKMPWPERDTRWPVAWEAIEGGATIEAGGERLVAIHTPGHAPDHLCFWHEESRTIFCGDLAVKGTTVYIPTNLRGDLIQYLASLERVLALRPRRMLPAHGPVIDDPEALLQSYIEHRQEREGQILDALRRGVTSPDEMVARIYRGLNEALVASARESVVAHLLKLEREGRVEQRAEGAQPRWHIIDA